MIPKQLRAFVRVYKSGWSWLITAVAGLVYYWIFQVFVAASSGGIVLLVVPLNLVYTLDISASILITLGIFSFRLAIRRAKIVTSTSSSAVSTFSILAAGVSAGCACQAPILFNLLYFLGLNSLEASSIVVSINDYQIQIILALIVLNVIMILVTASRIAANFSSTNKDLGNGRFDPKLLQKDP